MNPGNIPFHLRPNKAIERLLFVDLLHRLDKVLRFDDCYEYVGLGGPQMEDFRVLYERFESLPMLSLERDEQIIKRQNFNCPHTNVTLICKSSGEFIEDYRPLKKLIVWLDYAFAVERVDQISEFQTLLRLLPELSILKITLNANPQTLGAGRGAGSYAAALAKLMEQFGRFLPAEASADAVRDRAFPNTLLQIVAAASREALSSRLDWAFQPLSAFSYQDGQRMLTATGIVGPKEKLKETISATQITRWHFRNLHWSPPIDIRVPELTPKERIHINQLLPKHRDDLAAIHRAINFQLDPKRKESEYLLRQYIMFCRHYPQFGRVAF